LQSPKLKQQLRPILTVSQLTSQIKEVVEDLFGDVYVVGEVSNAKAYPSGHWYFSLKDKDANLSCVCFKSSNSAIKFKLEDGLMVVAQGNLSVYPPKGGYQLVATALEPVGIGEWQLAFEQLRAALEKEGLLDPLRKKPIPMVPRRVGVVTSPAAAALRDILSALTRRNRNVDVVIAPTRVQGEGSAEEIAQAIRDIEQLPGIEVIIIARGGGSIEDLWSFNTEVVARAVAACQIPIISGVGHETDITICDLVADLRAPTPTAAAELVAKGSRELFEKYKSLEQKLVFKVEQRLSRARRQLDRLSPVNALVRYQGRFKQYQMRVAHYKVSSQRSLAHLMNNLHQRWQRQKEKLQALAPTNVLSRGFAILKTADGEIVSDSAQVVPGQLLHAILKTGSLSLKVSNTQLVDSACVLTNSEINSEGAVASNRLEREEEQLANIVNASEIFMSDVARRGPELAAVRDEMKKDGLDILLLEDAAISVRTDSQSDEAVEAGVVLSNRIKTKSAKAAKTPKQERSAAAHQLNLFQKDGDEN
jgi:exodeoxyribonuclease VII large subunit